ncbi:ETV3 protein, partial [Tyrannus savana]|nr:ETV3 protein [Tyrannus savana]
GYHFPEWAYKTESSPGSRQIQLWHFILELLQKEEFRHVIAWQQGEYGEFVIKDPDEGGLVLKAGDPLIHLFPFPPPFPRYYYNKRILHKTKGKRFTYKFNFNKLVMPNYPFINIRPNGEWGPRNSGPLEFQGLLHVPNMFGNAPGTISAAGGEREGGKKKPLEYDPAGKTGKVKPENPPHLPSFQRGAEEKQVSMWAKRISQGRSRIWHRGCRPGKRKPDIVLPLFSRPGMYPDPHSPFAVSPLAAGRGGVLNVPLSPALSLTPTLFSYSPSPGLSPFAGGSCFSFNPEEMKHYLHSQACSVFNYHLSPRTFPRYPLVVPPLQCQVPLEEQPQFPIKLQPPPVGRKNRERPESAEEPARPRVKVEPPADREPPEPEGRDGEEGSGTEREDEAPVFARPAAPSAWLAQPGSSSSEEPPEHGESSSTTTTGAGGVGGAEKPPRDGSAEGGAQEKREDALMPPKLRLKRRWNGDRDRQAEPPEESGLWGGPKAVAAASDA